MPILRECTKCGEFHWMAKEYHVCKRDDQSQVQRVDYAPKAESLFIRAIEDTRDMYPRDVFPDGTENSDRIGAMMARRTCDNVLARYKKYKADSGQVKRVVKLPLDPRRLESVMSDILRLCYIETEDEGMVARRAMRALHKFLSEGAI